MKRTFAKLSLFTLLSAVLIFTGCKKDDTAAPIITLNGNSAVTVSLNASYTDAGAVADDAEDGQVTVTSDFSTTNPNVNLKGNYTITYTAIDAAGNKATATRSVAVVNDAEFLAGSYVNAYDSCQSGAAGTFNATITTSNTTNNAFSISNFGGFGTSVTINGTRSSNTLSFASSQSLGATSSLISGSGTITSTTSPTTFNVSYTWTDGSSTEVCISNYTK